MKNKDRPKTHSYEGLIKALRIISALFMVMMLVLCVIFIVKNNISVKNADAIAEHIHGGAVTVALILIGFTLVKSFALVFPPIILFFVSGLLFKSIPIAITVNLIASAISLVLPYYLGRFTGKDMLTLLEKKYKAIKKLENFTDENAFAVVFAIKVSGIIPSDLSSVIFGAMKIPFIKYFAAANAGLLVLNVSWSCIGVNGDLSNPLTYLYMLPILVCLIGVYVFMKKAEKKKNNKKQ